MYKGNWKEVEEPVFKTIVTKDSPTTTKVTTPTTTISFRDSSEYLTILVIAVILLAGAIVFLIGAAIIMSKK